MKEEKSDEEFCAYNRHFGLQDSIDGSINRTLEHSVNEKVVGQFIITSCISHVTDGGTHESPGGAGDKCVYLNVKSVTIIILGKHEGYVLFMTSWFSECQEENDFF